MNQLKEWGFSAQWWRGEKGEYWVITQAILFLGFVLLPIYPVINPEDFAPIWKYASWGLTGLFGWMAAFLLVAGILKLGNNLTPLPHPKDDGALVTDGVYGVVRHPIYSGVIFAAIAYGCWQWSVLHLISATFFFVFFDIKSRKEERWLRNTFPSYDAYQVKTKKLIPGIY